MLTFAYFILIVLLCFINLIQHGIYLFHKLQQFGYENEKFVRYLNGDSYRTILIWNLFEIFIPLLLILSFYFFKEHELKMYKSLSSAIMIIVFAWKIGHPFFAGWIGPKAIIKKKLVYTARIKRLIFTYSILCMLLMFFLTSFTVLPFVEFSINSWRFFQFDAFVLLLCLVVPLCVFLSNILNFPIEKQIHGIYYRKAKKKLAASAIKRIGITGSFGKTSVKFFSTTLLAEQHATLTTPSSFNTPMGLSKIINESSLEKYHYFVAEMGADRVGDIDYLAKLIHPEIGVITTVGAQHLETFGTVEKILQTKLELFDAIPPDGILIYNYDVIQLREAIRQKNYPHAIYTFSTEPKNQDKVDLYAHSTIHTREGLQFMAELKTGETIEVKTTLLGRHNVENVSASILVALACGLNSEEIKNGIKKITSVEHRLQRIDPGTGVLILDDAFNSNYSGAIEAVSVLAEISGGNKVLVTPGFVELGEEEDRYNRMFGEYAAKRISHAILIGVQKTFSIKEGLMNGGFSYDKIFSVNSLVEAQAILASILKPGDVVLFENDLPDVYSE